MREEFEKTIPIPYYQQLEIFIKEKIINKHWENGDFLPTERELCSQFGVSRTTLRKSMDELVQQHVLKKIPGRGYIVNHINNSEFEDYISFYKYLVSKKFDVKTEILEFDKTKPPLFIKKLLELQENDYIFKIKRLRTVNGEPWYFIINYMPYKKCPDLKREDLENASLLDYMKSQDLETVRTRRYIYAINADKENANLLKIKEGSPILIFDNINYDKNNSIIESSINFCRCDKIIFENTLYQNKYTEVFPKEKDSISTLNDI